MSKIRKLSVVIPVFNEEKSLKILHETIKSVLDKISAKKGKNYEIIFIDDGSSDRSFSVLKNIHSNNKESVRLIKLRKNFGKGAALSCGFKHAKGDCVITIDSDLQDSPEEMPRFIEKLDQGFDVVSGWKVARKDPLPKKIFSYFFNIFASFAMGFKLHDVNCGIKAYKSEVLSEVEIYGDLYRFIPLLAYRKGFKVCEIPVKHYARKYGRSKYGWKRLFGGSLDLLTVFFITHYKNKPLHFFGILGIILFLLGFSTALFITLLKITTGTIQGHIPLLLFSILSIIVGVQLISLGLLGELYSSNSKKKEYLVEFTTYK